MNGQKTTDRDKNIVCIEIWQATKKKQRFGGTSERDIKRFERKVNHLLKGRHTQGRLISSCHLLSSPNMSASPGKTRRDCSIRHLAVRVLLVMVVFDTISTSESASNQATWVPLPSADSCLLDKYRVPYAVYPVHYNLSLQINMHSNDPSKFTYNGTVKILVKCTETTNKIVLHSNVSRVLSSSIKIFQDVSEYDSANNFERVEIDTEKQFFTIILKENLEVKEEYYLEMQFSGPIGNVSQGIYYTSYKKDGQTRYVIATNFHPIHARKVFPCFDEPAMKATFSLTITKPVGLDVYSSEWKVLNTTIYTIDGVRYDETNFKETEKISTSALGFIICDFKLTGKINGRHKEYDGYLKQGSLDNSTSFAVNKSNYFNDHFRLYFGTGYQFRRRAIFGLPNFDFTMNLRIYLIKESRLAFSYNDDYNFEDEENVVRSMSYLTASEWLDNFVTPRWWDDISLAHGIARFYEHTGIDSILPLWKTWDHFVLDNLHVALKHDATFDSRPVHTSVVTQEEILDLFDWVTYRKTPSLFRMLDFFLGPADVKAKMKEYIKHHKHASASHSDLFSRFDQQATYRGLNINVTAIMETWIHQINYPVVKVERDFNKRNTIIVTQERFLANPTIEDPYNYPSPFNYRWTIPVTITTSSNPNFDTQRKDIFWIQKTERTKILKSDTFVLNKAETQPWILANVRQIGYYRVNYQEGNWRALINQLKHNYSVIESINRAQIIDDSWNLAKANHVPLNLALDVLDYLELDHEYLPWYTGWQQLSYIDAMLSYLPLYGSFQALMKQRMSVAFRTYGIIKPVTDHMSQYAQSLIAHVGCYYGVESCKNNASLLFEQFKQTENKAKIIASARKTVYCQGVADGEWEEWKFVLKMFKQAKGASEKKNLLLALTCTKHPWILRHHLDLLLKEESLFDQDDALNIIISIINNHNGRYLAWDFYRSKYQKLKKRYPKLACDSAVPSIVENFNTVMELQEVSVFYLESCSEYFVSKFATQIQNKIQTNIAWLQTNIPLLKIWLKKHQVLEELPR